MELQDYAAITNDCGKFEGETGLANWYWNCVMNGDGEDHPQVWDGLIYTLFTVDYEESQAFPEEVKIGDTVVIWEDSQGYPVWERLNALPFPVPMGPCRNTNLEAKL